jgi:hypothetical protein
MPTKASWFGKPPTTSPGQSKNDCALSPLRIVIVLDPRPQEISIVTEGTLREIPKAAFRSILGQWLRRPKRDRETDRRQLIPAGEIFFV